MMQVGEVFGHIIYMLLQAWLTIEVVSTVFFFNILVFNTLFWCKIVDAPTLLGIVYTLVLFYM